MATVTRGAQSRVCDRWWAGPLAVVALALVLAGCGDDDDVAGDTTVLPASDDTTTSTADDTTTTSADDDPVVAGEGFCDLARELDEQESFPSDEQLEALMEAAPDEIAEDVRFVAEQLIEAEDEAAMMALFGDPEIQEHLGPIEAYEAEDCGIETGPQNPEGVSTDPDPDAAQVAVVATDYDFDFDAPSSGAVSFVMSNQGDEPHFMGIGKLNDGVTLDEAIRADDPTTVTSLLAESDVALPGEEAVLTFEDLEPGTYGMVCFIPADDGEPHAFKGMAVEFEVE